MPRFYFNMFLDGAEPDEEGTECPDVYVAQAHAVRTAGEIMLDLGRRFWSGGEWRLELTDADGKRLFIVRFSAEEVS
jgi:hypothetical protein